MVASYQKNNIYHHNTCTKRYYMAPRRALVIYFPPWHKIRCGTRIMVSCIIFEPPFPTTTRAPRMTTTHHHNQCHRQWWIFLTRTRSTIPPPPCCPRNIIIIIIRTILWMICSRLSIWMMKLPQRPAPQPTPQIITRPCFVFPMRDDRHWKHQILYNIYIYIYISIYKLLSNYSHFFRFYYRGSMIPILRNERLGICMFHGTIRCGSHHLVSFTYTRHFCFIRHGDSHTPFAPSYPVLPHDRFRHDIGRGIHHHIITTTRLVLMFHFVLNGIHINPPGSGKHGSVGIIIIALDGNTIVMFL